MLFKLLTAPLAGPMAGFRFVLGQVQQLADQELMGVDHLREELLLLNLRLEEGEITDDEFASQEAEIMARLRAAREHQGINSGIGIESYEADVQISASEGQGSH